MTDSDTDDETFFEICQGIEHAVKGVHIHYDKRRHMADDSFLVPIVFDSTIGDPLPIVEWFKQQGFTLRSHRDGANAGSFCFSLSVPMRKTRHRFGRIGWMGLMLAVMLCIVTTYAHQRALWW